MAHSGFVHSLHLGLSSGLGSALGCTAGSKFANPAGVESKTGRGGEVEAVVGDARRFVSSQLISSRVASKIR